MDKVDKQVEDYISSVKSNSIFIGKYNLSLIRQAFIDGRKSAVSDAVKWMNNFYSEDRHCYLVHEDIKKFENDMMA